MIDSNPPRLIRFRPFWDNKILSSSDASKKTMTMRMTRWNRFLFAAAVVVQQQLLQLVLSSATVQDNNDDIACLKMQLWSNDD
jgi:hypothetical protein